MKKPFSAQAKMGLPWALVWHLMHLWQLHLQNLADIIDAHDRDPGRFICQDPGYFPDLNICLKVPKDHNRSAFQIQLLTSLYKATQAIPPQTNVIKKLLTLLKALRCQSEALLPVALCNATALTCCVAVVF